MDPHLSAIREWDKNYFPSEKEAYHKARINRYYFPNIGEDGYIGTLSRDELETIASHPPNINLSRYKRYKRMTLEELENKFPALVHIIGPNNITEEDLFYYATRGWIPQYDNLNYKIDRYNKYNDLSEVGKSLMDLLYQDLNGYLEGLGHPLEPYIISFDNNMDNEAAIRSIAERIGIYIPPNKTAHDIFYEKLYNHIKDYETHGYERIRRQNSLPTGKIINMTEKQYNEHTKNKNNNYGLYLDRLTNIRNI